MSPILNQIMKVVSITVLILYRYKVNSSRFPELLRHDETTAKLLLFENNYFGAEHIYSLLRPTGKAKYRFFRVKIFI